MTELNFRKAKPGSPRPYLAMRVLTPFGTAQWPFLDRPQRHHNPDGTYKVDIVVDPEDSAVKEMKATLVALGEAYRAEYKPEPTEDDDGNVLPVKVHVPVKIHKDKEGAKTGKVIIRTKLDAIAKRADGPVEQRPTIVDSKTNPLVPVPKIGAGTKLRVACDAIARFVKGQIYVTLNMRVVQIMDLIEWSSDSPESYGMDEIDGGYVPDIADDISGMEVTSGDGAGTSDAKPKF